MNEQVVSRHGGLRLNSGRLPGAVSSSRALLVARLQAQRDLRHGLKRLGAYLRDPSTQIDDVYLRAIAQLADRVGMPRVSMSAVATQSTSFSATAAVSDAELKSLLVAAIVGGGDGE